MRLQYLRAFIVLLAGFVTLVANMKAHTDVTSSLFIVLVVLIVFYILSTLAMELLQRLGENKHEDENLRIIDNDAAGKDNTEEVHVSFDDDEEME